MPSSLQGAPARERPCSCSSVPANSASSRPLSEPSKQPESRGMSTLGSDTVCTTGSWPLSAPSSASSLPAVWDEDKMEGLGPKWVRGRGRGGMAGCFQNPSGPGPGQVSCRQSALLTPSATSASLLPTSSTKWELFPSPRAQTSPALSWNQAAWSFTLGLFTQVHANALPSRL